jgi:hypothetical protein
MNVEPRAESTRRECAQPGHKPAIESRAAVLAGSSMVTE